MITHSVGLCYTTVMNDLYLYAKRIFNKYKILESGCWEWQKGKTKAGYGQVTLSGKRQYAHRVMYVLFYGEIEIGKIVDHICNNPSCINPKHLQAISQLDNTIRSQIAIPAKNKRKTHCKNGHEFTLENTYTRQRANRNIERDCMACRTMRNPARYE